MYILFLRKITFLVRRIDQWDENNGQMFYDESEFRLIHGYIIHHIFTK